MPRVYWSKINKKRELEEILLQGLNFLNWERLIPLQARVFLKPNLGWAKHLPGVTSPPRLIDALLGVLKQRTSRLFVGESDGGNFPAEAAFESHDMYQICAKHDAQLVNLSTLPSTVIQTYVGRKKIEIETSKFLLEEIDVFITVPVLKTHVVTSVSLGLKNQWGCIPSSMRLLYHPILNEGIVVLNRFLSPHLCIIDGSYALNGRGPVYGEPVPLNTIIMSDNIVAADSAGACLLGLQPRDISHIRLAEDEGLGPTDLKAIEVNRPLPPCQVTFRVRRHLLDYLAIVTYKSYILSKLVYDSPITPIIYRFLGKKPPGVPREGVPLADIRGD